ncbi:MULTISPECIES: hypothetical protein [unclassified Clostridium]|uniref:hypothetical protein n=1 Tax=unclassified Clostridium TaxID=2614128 RepID=UPI001485B0B1|nr:MULTISPECIES: hypothetical protein [unclassified Clostridium]
MESGNILYEMLVYLGGQMGVGGYIQQGAALLEGAMLLIALLTCFFGYKLFRVWSAVAAFLLTAIGITALMQGVADRGTIVTAFAIVGLIMAFLAFQWPKASAFLVCGVIGYGLAGALTPLWWVRLLAGAVLACATIPLSGWLIVGATALWGAFTLSAGVLAYLGYPTGTALQWVLTLVMTGLGVFVQYKTNRLALAGQADARALWARWNRKKKPQG